jgi:formylglycine-generating enzyme required for sulfatase activity
LRSGRFVLLTSFLSIAALCPAGGQEPVNDDVVPATRQLDPQADEPDQPERRPGEAPESSPEKAPPSKPPAPSPPSRSGPDTVFVEAGGFLLGNASTERRVPPEEKPQRRITLSAFRIDRFEVTNSRYRTFLDAIRSIHPGTCHDFELPGKDHTPEVKWWADPEWNAPEKPVIGVDWYDAYAYCAWAGKRLPTEAEWEKAARGTDGRKYPWGDEFPASILVGNFADEAAKRLEPTWTVIGNYDDGFAHTAPVGTFPGGASPYGAEDMAGNVWEWVNDYFYELTYQTGPAENPQGPSSGALRTLRGGSWDSTPDLIRITKRHRHYATYRGISFGFRCAMDVK